MQLTVVDSHYIWSNRRRNAGRRTICQSANALRLRSRFVPEACTRARHDEDRAYIGCALRSRFVPPGPEAARRRVAWRTCCRPARNFYAVDPRALPSMAALADRTGISRETCSGAMCARTGGYPCERRHQHLGHQRHSHRRRTIIAQVLAAARRAPRFWAAGQPSRESGVEVISAGRSCAAPRIDVVCRISGFFRDRLSRT